MPVTNAPIHFLKKDDLHEVEKPYAFRFPVKNIAQTNMEMERVDSIPIEDVRGRESDFTLHNNGFTVLKMGQDLEYESYFDELQVPRYFQAVEELLKQHLNATHAKVFRHGIRKRHAEFPTSTGSKYEYDQPTSVAHVGM
jgi:hypothetical protein